jgi:hypothetical protein
MTYFRQGTLTRLGRSGPATQQAFTFPASVAGINAADSLMQMAPQDCLYTYNMMPSEYGLRLRKGYREWAINIKEDIDTSVGEVRTIIPFESALQSVSGDRLFAVTEEGIWDVTSFNNQQPVQSVDFTDETGAAGYGVFCEFTGDAADSTDLTRGHYLYYADERNGIWQYTEATDTWEQPPAKGGDGGDTPVDPPSGWYYRNRAQPDETEPDYYLPFPVDDVAFVMVHKQRIWVILEDDDDAWYLPIGSIAGELKRFIFGSKLPSGGNLVGLWTWSIDGGDGVDDYMVAIGRGGDVVLYQGDDPEIIGQGVNPWATRGTWFIGELPTSRRVVGEYGPDLYLLSTYGISSLADLLRGVPPGQQSPSQRVNRFLRADVERGKDRYEWQLVVHPGDGFMQVITPKPTQTPYLQYTMNLQTLAWGFWQDVPIICAASWNGQYYMGGLDGRMYINDGGRDNEQLPAANEWTNNEVEVPGPEWTIDTVENEYTVDGTQDTTTRYMVAAENTLEPGVEYEVFYKIKDWVSGQHSLTIEADEVVPASVDDGVFITRYTPIDPSDRLAIVATVDGIMTFYDVTVRVAGERGEPIKFRTLTSFQAPQGHTNHAQVGMIRTVGIFAGTANLNCRAVYDYRVESRLRNQPGLDRGDPGIWDSAIWDRDIWDFEMRGENFIGGAFGMGRTFAVLMVGNSTTRVNIVAWDISFRAGGYL